MVQADSALPLALQPPDPAVQIRRVELADIPALRADCWYDQTETHCQQHLRQVAHFTGQQRGQGVVIVADDGITLNGYGQMLTWSRSGEISDLIISASCRSQGLGTALIQYLTHVAHDLKLPAVELGVAESNLRARALYERLGFQFAYTLKLKIRQVEEPVHYLQLRFADYFPR